MNFGLSVTVTDRRSFSPAGWARACASAVPDLPKPMAPVGGRPFLEYQLDYWIAQGIRRFVLSVGYRHEIDHAAISATAYRARGLDYAIEETPLGTGGALLLRAVEPALEDDSPFLLLNGDTYFAVDLEPLTALARRPTTRTGAFRCFAPTTPTATWAWTSSPTGRIPACAGATPGERPGGLANGGVYWIHPRALRDEAARSQTAACRWRTICCRPRLPPDSAVLGFEFAGTFIDIGVPDDYRRAADAAARGEGNAARR